MDPSGSPRVKTVAVFFGYHYFPLRPSKALTSLMLTTIYHVTACLDIRDITYNPDRKNDDFSSLNPKGPNLK
jgi:hypothetical protein